MARQNCHLTELSPTPSPPARCREIIANLAKAAGLATMIAAMRPDIDNVDEYVRNTTARAFSGARVNHTLHVPGVYVAWC